MAPANQLRSRILERTLSGLDRIAELRGRVTEDAPHLIAGLEGEEVALHHLRRNDYRIVARRWTSGTIPGDLDLIAWQGSLLCFVEVKTRTAQDLTPAETAVDSHKRNVLRRLARQYLRLLPAGPAPQIRFDVISVYLVPGVQPEVAHFENVFGWNEGARFRQADATA